MVDNVLETKVREEDFRVKRGAKQGSALALLKEIGF